MDINIIGIVDKPKSEEMAYAATNARIDNIIAHNNDTEGNTELLDIRTGADGTVYASAGTAVRTQVNALYEEIERYKNGEKNAVLTAGAYTIEKTAFENLLYIKAYGIDLSGYYISTIVNTQETPYRIILKKDNDSAHNIFINNTDGTDNYCCYKAENKFIVVGYRWSAHNSDVNLDYNHSHIKILDTVHSTDSIISYLDNKVSDAENSIISMDSEIRDLRDAMFEDAITDTGIVTSVIEQSYLAGSPTYIQPISNPVFKCTVYQVRAGSTYRFIANNYSLGGSFPSVVFTTTEINAAGTLLANSDVLYSADTSARNVDFIYNCTQNGYIVIAWMSNKTEIKMFETEKVRVVDELNERVQFIESKTNDLNNKTIAVLGDSIMMLQRTNYSGTNTVSYLGSDGITYTFDQLTNINGKLYVTADNSILCTVVNSNQNKLDNQNWDALKAKTGAADIINCGLGGATVKERQIITEYPYPDGDGKTGSLSNEVKMLKRLVQNGRSAPDCIVIWLGTNDSTGTLNTGNYDEIMALDYNTLADDTLGRSYRQTFYGGLRYSLETLCREYPFATIFVFTPIQTNPSNTRTYENLSSTGEALMKMANRYSCICVNALTEIGIVDLLEASDGSGNFLADGLHPNADGKKVFASFTAKKLNTLYFSKR